MLRDSSTVVPKAPARYLDLLTRLQATRRIGVALGLERTQAVLARLGNPERGGITVQIAGTNGKGSTAAMTDAILRAAGMRTGLFTSPHLNRFTERIRIDGREVDGDRLAALDEAIVATGIPLTYFEIATVLAFLSFAEAGVDAVVLETGLGGRLDATTVCRPVATAITSIDFDHTELLGSTLAEIAREKAGIAKSGVPLFLGQLPAEADAEIAAVALRLEAPVLRLGVDFAAPQVPVALSGPHQRTNAALAIALARSVAGARGHALADQEIERGLAGVVWPGRLEWIGGNVLLDCAHNPEGAAALARVLADLRRNQPSQRCALVVSIVGGKAAGAMLAALAPCFEEIVMTRSTSDRALDPDALLGMAPIEGRPGLRITAAPDPLVALAAAQAAVGPGGLVVGAGSTFLVGDLRAALLGEQRDPLPTSDPIATAI